MTARFFITGTGTGVGKTWVGRGLARSLRERNFVVAALKPIETGCQSEASDARALAAAGEYNHRLLHGFYRCATPLAPYAASQLGAPPVDLDTLRINVDSAEAGADFSIVEGAGGLLVPLTRDDTIADLILALDCPVILVASDRLGVLSDTLTTFECAVRRGIPVAAVVLTQHATDHSTPFNQPILAERLYPTPVLTFPRCRDDNHELASAAQELSDVIVAWPFSQRLPDP